jgi:predicted ribosomally synthesized peptide with SipW-like signal peptide
VIGLVSVASGSGTFASFSADVTNPGNTFASGTLFLHDNGGTTTCTSESGTLNVNPGTGVGGDACDVLFNASSLQGGAVTADLTLDNAGTVDASDMKFDASSCSVTDNSGATGSAVTFGSAPTCANFYITVQETDNTFASNTYCAFGTDVAGTCAAPTNAHTLANTNSLTLLKTTGNVNADLTASSTRYYVITILPSVTNDNTLQNRKVTFALSWHLDQ